MERKVGKFEKWFFKPRFGNIVYFLFIWLCTGFTLGTGILMGPVRWFATMARDKGWPESTEKLIVYLNILVLIVISFYLSVIIIRALLKTKKKLAKVAVPVLLALITVLMVWIWMTPSIMITENEGLEEVTELQKTEFHFGNYPGKAELEILKADSFTAVISLLHPAVVPFEPKLIADEEKLADSVGIELIHIPMLPWVSENKAAIDKVREIAINGEGKYFVHCYLGKDRVNVVKRIVKSVSEETKIVDEGTNARSLDDIDSFERGAILELSPDVYFTPLPTDEEYFGYIISGSFTRVVSLLDPDNPGDLKLIEKEKKFLKDYNIDYVLLPLPLDNYDPVLTLANVAKIKAFETPLIIHAFFTKGTVAERFIETYKSGLPSVSPGSFDLPLENGAIEFISSNLVAGATPTLVEIDEYLYANGIRKIAFTGEKRNIKKDIQAAAQELGIEWVNVDLNSRDEVMKLKEGGPWYVFGSSIEDVRSALM